MEKSGKKLTVNIRPDVGVYATYRRLSYRPWYAIAEFVDNSTQNYYDHKADLLAIYKKEKGPGKLRVEVEYDGYNNTLVIYDNAHGMEIDELTRALVLDKPPPDATGRCEYGMGLKTAACWFGATWTIQTSRLGSHRVLKATVHVPDLVKSHTEQIPVQEKEAPAESHFTRITIKNLYKPLRTKTPARIKEQLGSMYRQDLRSNEVEIIWNGDPVSFPDHPFLVEDLGNGIRNTWHKDINFEVPSDDDKSLKVHGWVGIRIPGKQREAGFALLRRGRVIVGGPGEGYKPIEVFGQRNSFSSERLVGELHMDSWPVTQAKDAFDWSGGLEDAFIERLKKACQDYVDKAEGLRVRKRRMTKGDLELAAEPVKEIITTKQFASAIADDLKFPDPPQTQKQEREDAAKLRAVSVGPIQYRLDVGTNVWLFRLHWQDQLTEAHWMQVSYPQDNEIDVFLNMGHPFLAPYLDQTDLLELIQKFVLALALAEKMARQTSSHGLVAPGDFRTYMNKVLRRIGEMEVRREH